ncbi:MAG TPA: hypothetical protein PKI03_20340, partial [Pseudomonadota bacterium]|nr:hypothetical protein [Pseudomonadota bacterium]
MSTGPMQIGGGRRLAAPAFLAVAALVALSPPVGWAAGPASGPASGLGSEPAEPSMPPPTVAAPPSAAPGSSSPTPAAPVVSPPPAAPSAPVAPPAPAASDPGAARPDALRDVDRRIGDLKDQIFRAKARLS